MFQAEKALVLAYFEALESRGHAGVSGVLPKYLAADCRFEGVHPFNELTGPDQISATVWEPLFESFSGLQRRQDIFIAGEGDADEGIWVMSMGHLMGLFDAPWLNIPSTNRLAMIRYAEFLRVEGQKITEVGFFVDVIDVMRQAGVYPLPPPTGAHFVVPGPRGHDGIVLDHRSPEEGQATMALVNRMVADLQELNVTGNDNCPPEYLARCWHQDMAWYGPCGIGSTYTIERYQQHHQYPFREGLQDKVFNGHRARIAEGEFAGWYGWANLSNKARGGFLGLPASHRADMRVVDVYRRSGDKLLENWVMIDLPWWLKQQGLDVLQRMSTTGAV